MCEVSLPNKEISLVYNKEILSKLENVISQSLAISIQEAVFKNESARLKGLLEKLLVESVSYYDTAKEVFYHGLVLGLCAMFSDSYFVASNRESGNGRFDIQLVPKHSERPGFLFELKAEKGCSQEELKELAQTALQQIRENQYDSEMRSRRVRTITKYGVAFSGKQVEVVTE